MKHCTNTACDRVMVLGNGTLCPFCNSILEEHTPKPGDELSREWRCKKCASLNTRNELRPGELGARPVVLCNDCDSECDLVAVEYRPKPEPHIATTALKPAAVCLECGHVDHLGHYECCDYCSRCGGRLKPFGTAPRTGHPLFYELTKQETDNYEKKNKDYANSDRPMGNFERVGRILSLYPNLDVGNPTVVCMVYLLKQLDCALHLLEEKREGEVEGIDSRLADIHTYAKIARIIYREHHWKDYVK